MRESTVEKYLHDQVTAAGGTTRKFKSPGRKNVPDRIVIWPGLSDWSSGKREQQTARVHFVECKAPGKKARPAQVREHERLRKLGCVVLLIDTKQKVNNYVKAFKNGI